MALALRLYKMVHKINLSDVRLYTTKEVRALLGVHENTLCNWRRQGRLLPVIWEGKFIRYAAKDIDEFLNAQLPQHRI